VLGLSRKPRFQQDRQLGLLLAEPIAPGRIMVNEDDGCVGYTARPVTRRR
jgi:hypothetical protein